MTRHRLPNRRPHEVVPLTFRGLSHTVGFNRRAEGQISEIFLDAAKQSTDTADDARDLALAVSIGLQHGVPLETLRHSALRDASGAPQGLLGAVCDALASLDQEQAA
jgi:hypothetical protein